MIRIFDGAQPMRYNHHGSSLEKLIQVFKNNLFVIGIKCIGGLIKKDKLGVFVYGSCNQNSLLLTLTQPMALATNLCVVTKR
jgi:hypothetical protein